MEKNAEKVASAIASFDSEWVWSGVSHNSYIDRGKGILPLALLERDVERQTKWIAEGRFKDFGGLWRNHDEEQVIGRALFSAIVPGTRMVLEAGVIRPDAAQKLYGRAWPMSIGYWYTTDKEGQYTDFVKFERSVLEGKMPMNALCDTFKVYQRDAATSGELTKFYSGEQP